MHLKNTRIAGLVLSLAVIFLFSCKKDHDPDPSSSNCKVLKAYAYDQGSIYDSAIYTYTNDKVTRVDAADYYFTLEYAGDRISKRNFYSIGSTTIEGYETVTYNADGTISKLERFTGSGSSAQLWERITYTYSGGKLQKVSTNDDDGTGNLVPYNEVSFEYTGNNITKERSEYFGSFPSVDTLTFQYDSKANYFSRQNNQFFLVDPFFLDVDTEVFPLFLSQNNVTTVVYLSDPLSPILFSYEEDSHSNGTKVKQDGELLFSYMYQCP
jgi:hypothetical protein